MICTCIFDRLPPKISNISALDNYYFALAINNSDFMTNLGSLLEFQVFRTQSRLHTDIFDLISPWPGVFGEPQTYNVWLTGINAFYVPEFNFFTIPLTISQKPFFNIEFPSAISYAISGIC